VHQVLDCRRQSPEGEQWLVILVARWRRPWLEKTGG